MQHAPLNLFLAGLLLLGLIIVSIELLAKRAAKTRQVYTSPFGGNTERVPPRVRVWQFILAALVAGVLAAGFAIEGQYFYSSIFCFYLVAVIYTAWVYRRGREPKLLEGIREFPDPPTLLKKP
jgi:hypothetical protein